MAAGEVKACKRGQCLIMKGQIEKVKKLQAIYLEYSDGSMIAVPENKVLKVGTVFMKAVGKEQLDWEVVRLGKQSVLEKLKKFFTI